jgi:hypothetical protein
MDLPAIFLPNSLQGAAILTVVLAFFGYLATFLSARILARRKDKLELVTRRLNEFYGPLYVASEAGTIAYRSLLKKQGKTQSFPILDSELKEWMLWVTTIFMPLNDAREKVIIEKAYLIIEEQIPHCLLDFVTHVHRAPLDHRLATGVRPLRRTLLCGSQGRADPPAAWLAVEALAPPDFQKAAPSRLSVISWQLAAAGGQCGDRVVL